ncbi:MAG TPA: glutathione S-transferase [Rhodocyclaceae bacterium]|nr:glutathione S-transferase [Rhodocyclaceae bacterium]
MNTLKLHRFPLSGHSHRAELFLSLLQLPHELVDVDLAKGAHKRPEFIALNSFGQVPVLEDGEVIVADSNAILVYLASRYGQGRSIEWLPADPIGAARVQRWLSVAAGLIAFGPARARLKTVFNATIDAEDAIARAHALLAVMDRELHNTPYLAGAAPTIADISAYAYVAHAPEGNVSLASYAQVRAWLGRIEALPGFVPMPKTAVGLAATEAA